MTRAQLIDFVNNLTPAKREFLTLYMSGEKERFVSLKTKEKLESGEKVLCPHCNSANVIKHGRFNNRLRYKCKMCLKHFNQTTAWELAHTRKGDKFQEYLSLVLGSVTIRSAARKLGVTDRTVFLWRKKIQESFTYLDAKVNSFKKE